MKEELKPCPFCNLYPTEIPEYGGGMKYSCPNDDCSTRHGAYTFEEWNSRPIEDALRAEYNALRERIDLNALDEAEGAMQIAQSEIVRLQNLDAQHLTTVNTKLAQAEEMTRKIADATTIIMEENKRLQAENEQLKSTLREAFDNCPNCRGETDLKRRCARCQTFETLL